MIRKNKVEERGTKSSKLSLDHIYVYKKQADVLCDISTRTSVRCGEYRWDNPRERPVASEVKEIYVFW